MELDSRCISLSLSSTAWRKSGIEVKPGGPGGLTIRQELQKQPSREEEINDVEENEELLIDEEMEEADSSRDKHEETFEEVPVEKVDTLKQFSNFQPYLNMKESAENGGINSLEKLQQVSFIQIQIRAYHIEHKGFKYL